VTHDELQSLLGVYALDAVEPDESALVEAHLAECARCRAEVAAHREAAARLGNVGGDAPAGVWDRIADQLAFESSRSPEPALPPNVIPLPSRRPLPLALLASLAAVAVALIGLLGVSTIRLQHQVDDLRSAVSAGGLQQAAAAAVLDPNRVTAQLVSADGSLSADVVILPSGSAYLVSTNLPALETSSEYQLWGLDNGQAVSLGLLGNAPRLAAFRVDSAVTQLMVTAEPKGGRAQPDSKILVQAVLPH
jgi:hypothetical protein